jgi:plastocyanin
MSIRSCTLIVVVVSGLAVACEQRSSEITGPSAQHETGATAPAAQVQPARSAAAQHAITLFDACDPATFNAVLGPGTCTRSGGVSFDNFVAELTRHHSAGAWHFAPSQVTMRVGEVLVANNRGGEAHTFTEVEEFGGGKVPFLNNLVALPTVAPECAQSEDIAPGASSRETEDDAGVEKYQCCIHPWMRAEVRVVEKEK